MTPVNDVLNNLNGQIAATQMVATLAIAFAAGNDGVAKNLATSIGKLSDRLDSKNHAEFNRGFQESIAKMQNIIANSTFDGGKVNMDFENFKAES